MFVKFLNWLRSYYRTVISSLGFWPTLISLGYAFLATLLAWLDTSKLTSLIAEVNPGLVIKDGDTARVILSTMVGGLVSLTVFSFTMVMAQLNRAASSYSPRLLPGLISSTSHQVVLGNFLGAIIFCLVVLISIEPADSSYELPGFAILVAVATSIGCLGTFVYFIHTISQSIQVTNILQRVSNEAATRLDVLGKTEIRNLGKALPTISDGHIVKSKKTGYFQGVTLSSLEGLAKKHGSIIEVIPKQGAFVLENTALARLSKSLDEDDTEALQSCFTFSGSGFVHENYVLGLNQITEIAVRAMSPGTNDPGTALSAINHLTHLLARRLLIDDQEVLYDDDGEPLVIISVVSFQELMYPLLASLRLYCKHDIVIVLKLVQMFDYLLQQPFNNDCYRETLHRELRILLNDARESIKTDADLAMLEEKTKALSSDTSMNCAEES